ncbi:MAG: hypothetical protein AAF810_24380 [Cyanobacteria bacterium P01_D01_bin.36]
MALSRMGPRKQRSRATWFERMMAAIALINLSLVLFDLSYIRFRDLYLRFLPEPTVWYGETFKGIEPDRTTTAYLSLVDDLEEEFDGSGTDEAERQRLLDQLVEGSITVINEDPFAIANKSGTLERIKNLMRDRMEEESSKDAFSEFWDEDDFQGSTAEEKLAFFNSEIRPLMETNYFRGISESGSPIDLFWRIDIWFMALFAAEFLARTYVLSRRYEGTNWFDAMLWRIYDVPLFIGLWRWVRVVPVVLRLHQARWLNLEPVRNRLSRALVSQFAVELTEIVLLRVIDQVQKLIREGDVSRMIANATDRSKYVDINGVDEVQTIAKRLSDVVVYQVLPKIKPELDALLQHSVVGALQQAPAYQGLQIMPGFNNLSAQISQQVVSELSKTLTQTLQNVFADEKGAALTSQLITRFTDSLGQEMQRADTIDEVRGLVDDLLEEIKLNYVEGIAAEDIEQLQASRYRLYGTTSHSR